MCCRGYCPCDTRMITITDCILCFWHLHVELMCVKRTDGGKKGQSQDGSTTTEGNGGDVDMSEVSQDEQSGEQWSIYCTLSPLGEYLLCIPVSRWWWWRALTAIELRCFDTANECTLIVATQCSFPFSRGFTAICIRPFLHCSICQYK